MSHEVDPVEIERGLSEGTRFWLAESRGGRVYADAGQGHTLNTLRRRGLLPPKNKQTPTWNGHQWTQKLTPLGCKVAELAKLSTRVGGGRSKRGPR